MTSSGNVSEHSTGSAVDIAAINGIPIIGHQGPGSITDTTIRRLLTLQGSMKPHQIISLMTFAGTDNTLSLPDHNDHIHIGFRADGSTAARGKGKGAHGTPSVLKPGQWTKLIRRIGTIDNPQVPRGTSKYALKVRSGRVAAGRRDRLQVRTTSPEGTPSDHRFDAPGRGMARAVDVLLPSS